MKGMVKRKKKDLMGILSDKRAERVRKIKQKYGGETIDEYNERKKREKFVKGLKERGYTK